MLIRIKYNVVESTNLLFATKKGANFVGFRVLPDRIRVRNDNLRKARKRLRELQYDYRYKQISLEKLRERIQSWVAHLKHADSYQLRQNICDYWIFCHDFQISTLFS